VRGVFDGIKVVEYGHFLLAPAATAILADWGADVVKIENFKAGGDPVRFPEAIEGQMPPSDIRHSIWFHYFNRNKRSIGLDVRQERGREVLCRLVKKSDVFATNFDPSAVKKQKIDYASLRGINPQLDLLSVQRIWHS